MNIEKANEEAVHLSGLMMHPGWAIISDEATQRIKTLTKALIWENEEKKKSELQSNIRSLEFLLGFPGDMLEAARRANEAASREDEQPQN